MEPVSAITMSLALGAAATAGKEVVGAIAKDAYAALKGLLKSHYPDVLTDHLEQAPQSKVLRAGLGDELAAAGAAQDPELAAAARVLIEIIEKHVPSAAAAIGVDLKDVSAASLHLSDIAAVGTGVKLEHGAFTGDVDIRNVRAGVSPASPTRSG